MSKINNKTIINMLIVFVFVSILTTTQGETISVDTPIKIPFCTSVIGVKSGDTCYGIAHKFKLSSTLFNSINPNLNCNKLFVGEWICIGGIALP
ncbi:putative LysM domain-containing protein [Helianthus anomalus]